MSARSSSSGRAWGRAHSGSSREGCRQQWGTRVNCRLARESHAFHREAEERLASRVELGFRECGYLFLAHSAEVLEHLRANLAVQHSAGVPSRLLTPPEAAEAVPGLDVQTVVGAGWCPEDGYYDRPQAVVEAFAAGAEVERADVRALSSNGGSWVVELATGETIQAGQVAVAAACDTTALLRPLGVDLPIGPESRWLFFGTPVRERLLEPLVVSSERRFAAKQLADGRLLASDLSHADEESTSAALASIRSVIRALLPRLEYVELTAPVEGVYDVTPDRQAILGRVPGHDGLWVAAGFSGHGFMLAPAVGRILAEAIVGAGEDEALRVLDPSRFAERRLVPEPQVV